jgi:hypothetical protein
VKLRLTQPQVELEAWAELGNIIHGTKCHILLVDHLTKYPPENHFKNMERFHVSKFYTKFSKYYAYKADLGIVFSSKSLKKTRAF